MNHDDKALQVAPGLSQSGYQGVETLIRSSQNTPSVGRNGIHLIHHKSFKAG